jgi:hypothetical protein
MKNILILSLAGFSIFTQAMPNVTFRSSGPSPVKKEEMVRCIYTDVLKNRKAPKEGDPDITTFALSQKNLTTSHANVDHEGCMKVLATQTLLDERSVQDQIGSILKDFPCKPGVPLIIIAEHNYSESAQRVFNLKHPFVIWRVGMIGCLDDPKNLVSLPKSCRTPEGTPDPDWGDVTYDELIEMLKKCRDDLIKKVHDEKLLEKWKSENDPNKTQSSSKH